MYNYNISTPILFLVFNRPYKTQSVFNVIQSVKPAKLYVAADAPRKNVHSDIENTLKVRKIVSQIDWKCETKYLFHEINQGCSLAGKKAWDWIFSKEEEMIFIEDDGLVSRSFFEYCQELLKKYRNNNRIAFIGGVNYGLTYGNASYFFSKIPCGTYSMATWKRVYELYEYKLDSYKETKKKKEFSRNFLNHFVYKYMCSKFNYYLEHGGNTYDLQMVYLVYKYNMLNIVPNVNMCTNIGFDYDGSNTGVDPNSKIARKYGNRPRYGIENIIHPYRIKCNSRFEKKYVKARVFNNKPWFYEILRFYSHKYFGSLYRNFPRIIKDLGLKNSE